MDAADQPPPAVLADLLAEDRVRWDVLEDRYGSLLELVRVLIGVVPNCDPYLEIWPPAFRSYNLMVPNLLNLPASLVGAGGPPASVVGTGMYVASRAAECPYCSAHTCSFALRRGADVDDVARVVDGPVGTEHPEVVAVASSLGAFPASLRPGERGRLVGRWGDVGAERIVMGVAMMGFLNKFMDAVGVELEASTVAETIGVMGAGLSLGAAGRLLGDEPERTAPPSADTLRTKLQVVPLIPGALRLDRRWQAGVPGGADALGEHLRATVGHSFDRLAEVRHRRAARAIGSMIATQLDRATTVVGLGTKARCAAVFAALAGDDDLRDAAVAIGAIHGVGADELEALSAWATGGGGPVPPGPMAAGEGNDALLVRLALEASPSPAQVTPGLLVELRAVDVPAAAMVEVVSWVAVLQLLHRLGTYLRAAPEVAEATA